MCEPVSGTIMGMQAIGALSSAGGAYGKSKADKQAYEYQAAVDRNNAQVLEYQATDALERGQQTQFAQGLKAASIAGSQRAHFAANGVSLDEGSPLNVLMDTKYMSDIDRATIADNAGREAWALRQRATNTRANAELLSYRARSENPSRAAMSSLLSSGGQVAGSWYKMSGGPGQRGPWDEQG
jgi:hypothetical protein